MRYIVEIWTTNLTYDTHTATSMAMLQRFIKNAHTIYATIYQIVIKETK